MDNRVYESIKMTERFDIFTQKRNGILELSKLPIPGSITVYLQGHLIEPESFDEYGNPVLSVEMTEYFTAIQKAKCRSNEDNYTEDIYARVHYEPMEFTIPKEDFDSVNGIQKALESLESFNNMLTNRQRYLKAFGKNATLSEYIIWGRYILDKYGKVHDWKKNKKNTVEIKFKIIPFLEEIRKLPDVCEINALRYFLKKDEILCYGPSITIPNNGAICPICGRRFSMYDLHTRVLSTLNGKSCHKNCLQSYEEQLRIDKITSLIDEIYEEKPTYEIIKKSSSSVTLLFKTSDGEIEIDDTLGMVAIEWGESFKPFDIAIFNDEKELKWYAVNGEVKILSIDIPKNFYTKNSRGIMARHNYAKAAKYLSIVRETVNKTN